jgi:hypothetical protein
MYVFDTLNGSCPRSPTGSRQRSQTAYSVGSNPTGGTCRSCRYRSAPSRYDPRERVDEARPLHATGLTAADVARRTGLPWGTVAPWCRGDRRRSTTVERGGRAACPRCTSAPLDTKQYAYVLGQYLGDGHAYVLGQYLGDGHITAGRRGVHSLSIVCADAWLGVRLEVVSALVAVLPASKVSMVQRIGCAEVKSYSTHWTRLSPSTAPGASTSGRLPCKTGSRKLWIRTPASSCAGSSTRTAAQ